MTVEAVTYISDLDNTLPGATDLKSEGDDHIRNLKTALLTTFPNVTGAVTPTHTELNYVDGVTSAIQTQIDTLTAGKADTSGETYTGTHDFTGATLTAPTQTVTDNSTKVATTAFVSAASFVSALPGQSGNAGKFVTTDGTNASWSSLFGTIQVIGTNTTAVASNTYILTSSLTLTLPATPSAGDWVGVQNSSGTTTAVIGRNGSNIMSLAEDLTLDADFVSVKLVYADATRGWVFGG